MMEEPQQPEDDAPEEGVPGEPGEATPSEAAPEEQLVPEDTPAGSGEEHPGPEIEGMEELAQAAGEAEAPAAEAPAAEAEVPAAEEPAAEAEADAAEEAPNAERPRPGARRRQEEKGGGDEVIPGAHLEPDLVLEEQRPAEGEFGEYAEYAETESREGEPEATADEASTEEQPAALTPLDLAADARYRATGKRKSAVARVTLKPGEGTYTINGRHLDEYFPRVRLQRMGRQPLEATGNQARMDVVALIHGGGVSAQASALRHGIARALVEADPTLRGELKRRGYLTRDPRVKERKKAGLKKARKRPQFSKR
jgi:small subunit ribosomal protein S9